MIGSKQHKQYRMWIAAAIQKARKDPSGKVSHVDISPRLDPSTAFSFMQWAVAEGWLHTDGHRVGTLQDSKMRPAALQVGASSTLLPMPGEAEPVEQPHSRPVMDKCPMGQW